MTPYDIYRKFTMDIVYVPPEQVAFKLAKTLHAIAALEEIFDQGPNTEAAEEAVEVLVKMRKFEAAFRLQQ